MRKNHPCLPAADWCIKGSGEVRFPIIRGYIGDFRGVYRI